jgi:hypothetical protein
LQNYRGKTRAQWRKNRQNNSWCGEDTSTAQSEYAGAITTTVDQIISELAIDWTTPNGQKLSGILAYH